MYFGFRLQHAYKQACYRLVTFFRHRSRYGSDADPKFAESPSTKVEVKLRRLRKTP